MALMAPGHFLCPGDHQPYQAHTGLVPVNQRYLKYPGEAIYIILSM